MKVDETAGSAHIALTAGIVSAYVASNSLPVSNLPALIAATHAALAGLGQGAVSPEYAIDKPTPTEIRKSISHEALISFEDGKPYRTLRRHLSLRGLTPEAYKAKWGLPVDYPVIAASYSEKRSALAKGLGLGRKRTVAEPAAEPTSTKPTRAGRSRKSKASA